MQLENILKKVALGAIFLVPFVPLVVWSELFFPYIVGKAFLFRVLIEIAFGAWAILAIKNKEYRPKLSLISISIFAFVFIMLLADFFGENPLKSFWSNFERMEGWVTLLHSLGYFIVISSLLNSKKLWRRFLHTTVFISFFIALYGISKLLGSGDSSRLYLSLGNAAYLAVYMLIHIFLVLFLWYRRGKENAKIGWWHWFYGLIVLIEIIVLYYTATRGAILGFLGAVLLITCLIVLFGKKEKKLRKYSVGFLIGVLVLIGGFFLVKESKFVRNSEVLNRFATISLEESTTKSRFILWGIAWEGFKEKPILGWGQESFNYVFNEHYSPELYGQEEWFDRTHNVFFDWLIAGGVLGLASYLFLFFALLYCLWSKKFDNGFSFIEKSLFTGLLAGYFVHNLFVFDNLTSYILCFTLLGFVHNQAVREKERSSVCLWDKVSEENKEKIITPIFIVLTLFAVYFFNAKALLANTTLLKALAPHPKEGISANLEYYQKALSYNSFANQEIREQLLQFMTKIRTVDVDEDIKKELFNLAVTEAEKEIKRDPQNIRIEVFLGSLLGQYSLYEEGLAHLQKALEVSPKKQSIMFTIASIYINQERYDDAYNLLKKAYLLEPNYLEAKKMFYLSAILSGKASAVEKEFGSLVDSKIAFDMNFVNAYAKRGDPAKAIQILEKMIENNPKETQYRISLAAIYFENGQNLKSIATLEKAIELNPDFKARGEQFIEEVRAKM